MALRIPPGRAGRTWLIARLQMGRRGVQLLDRKREALLRERARVRTEAQQAQQSWQDAAARALVWNERTALVDGAVRLALLARHVEGQVGVDLAWSNLMGAVLPSVERVGVPEVPALGALGGSSAAVIAAQACAEATRAGVRLAVAQRADDELSAELRRTARRLRALRQRWIPQHEQALAALDLALDELQREQAVRVRWLTQHDNR